MIRGQIKKVIARSKGDLVYLSLSVLDLSKRSVLDLFKRKRTLTFSLKGSDASGLVQKLPGSFVEYSLSRRPFIASNPAENFPEDYIRSYTLRVTSGELKGFSVSGTTW